jgi:signal transduction histidine kinase
MKIYSIFPLISGISVLILGLFVFLKNKKSRLHQIFFLFTIAVTVWLLGTSIMFTRSEDEQILFWDRIVYIGVVFIPVLGYHFGLLFAKIRTQKILLYSGYLFSFIFLVLSRTKYFIDDVYIYSWGAHSQARTFHHFFLVFFAFYIFLFILNSYRDIKSRKGIEKTQAKYVFIALIVLTTGITGFLPAYKINHYPFIAFLAAIICTLIFTYAIVRHRLMDIRIVAREVTVYGVSLIVSAVLCLIGLSLIMKYVLPFVPFSSSLIWLMLAISIFGIVVFQFVKEKFSQFANRYLFYPLYSFEKTIENFSKKLSRFIDLNHLVFSTTDTLKEVFKLDNIALILRKLEPPKGQLKLLGIKEESGDTFYLAKNIGFNEEEISLLIKNKFLLYYLEKNKKPLVSDELGFLAEEIKEQSLKNKFLTIKKFMEKMKAGLYLPLLIEDRLVGVFVLGKKVSGDAYSIQDLNLLETISSQIAIAINNAQLYEQMQRFNQILKAKVVEATKELINAYKELKKLDESKTEFLSLASHQLRTPLSTIKGYLSMILEGDYGPISEEVKEAVKTVYQSNERLIGLVNDLLNVTRIEAGKLEYNPTLSDLEKLIKEVTEEMKLPAKKKNLKIEVFVEKLPKFNFDPEKIRQVLINLLDNAIKYTEEGKITVIAKTQNSNVRVEVKDTGIGISRERLNSLFQWFSRGRGVYRLESGGFGLGLYIAKKIIEKAKGKIWAESEGEGKGSTFIFTLPINK